MCRLHEWPGLKFHLARNKFTKPTIFDQEKKSVMRKGYRDAHPDNPNKIINNNTQFRIFNQMRPRESNVPPIEDMNINPNKWKPKVTYYYRENKGMIQDPEVAEDTYKSSPGPPKDREIRIGDSKRKLQNYLNLVNTDMRMLNHKYREKLTSKSAMTKLPPHDETAYAVAEIARTGPTNKTLVTLNKHLKQTKSNEFTKQKYSVPSHPVLDMQKRKIVEKETNLDRLQSKRFHTIDTDTHKITNVPQRMSVLTPKNPRPLKVQEKLSKLEVNNRYNDKTGSITYRDNNPKAVYPLNPRGNVKNQIQKVVETNNKNSKEKYPQIAPVFKPAVPRKVDIEQNPLKKVDTSSYFGVRKGYGSPPALALTKNRPEFMDLLSMSRKLDQTARAGKNI